MKMVKDLLNLSLKQRIAIFSWVLIQLMLILVPVSGLLSHRNLETNLLENLNLRLGDETGISSFLSREMAEDALDRGISPADIEFVTDPLSLKKGIYLLSLEHLVEHDGASLYLTSENIPYGSLLSDEISFNIIIPRQKMYFWLKEDSDDLRLHINYGTQEQPGSFIEINELTLFRSRKTHVVSLIKILFILSLIDLTLLFLYKSRDRNMLFRIIPIALLFIALISSINIFCQDIPGHTGDMDFHMYRIEGIAEGLKNGMFPVKVAPSWMNGYSYAVGVFYGQLFLYLPALMRLLGFDIVTSLNVFIFFMNLLTAVCAYYGFKTISKSPVVGLCSAAVYNFALYRLANLYVRGAVGEYEAAAFLPLIMAGLYCIFTCDTRDKDYGKYSIIAAFGYSGLIHTHMLSCEMAGFFTIVLCLLCVKRVFEKKRFIELAKTVIFTIGISASFIVPFLDFFRDKFSINDGSRALHRIQQNGADLREIFAVVFYTPTGRLYGFSGLVPVLSFIAAGIVLFVGIDKAWKKHFQGLGIVFILSILSVWMASHHFPYDKLCRLPVLNSLVISIQFPTRFVSMTMALWSMLFCLLLGGFMDYFREGERLCLAASLGLTVLSAFIALDFQSGMIPYNYSDFIYHDTAGMDSFAQMNGEYVPSGTDVAYLNRLYVYNLDGNVYVPDYQLNSTELNFIAISSSENAGLVTVPRLFYRGYVARDTETGRYFELTRDVNNSIQVVIPAGYSGKVSVYFREFWYWRLAEIVSLLTVAGMVIHKNRKSKR